MGWFLLAIVSAAGAAGTRVLIKISSRENREVILFSRYFYALVPSVLLAVYLGKPEIGWKFYPAVFAGCIAEIAAIRFMIKSLTGSDMSRSVPLLALTPVFVLFTGFFLLGEVPNLLGLAGVMVVVSGSYSLNASLRQGDALEPFRLLLKQDGALPMLATAVLFSVAAPCFKIAVLNSSAVFTMAVTFGICTVLAFLNAKVRGSNELFPRERKRLVPLLGTGVTLLVVGLCLNYAYKTGMTSYVISVKRMSIFFNVMFGVLILHEQRRFHNLVSAGIMVAGTMIIGLSEGF